MKTKLIIKIACLTVITVTLSAVFFYFAPINPDNYLAGTICKHRRLNSLQPPRLIITGDSTVAYDIDSDKLQKAFHCNVANMGLHVGLGYRYQLNEIKPYIQAGDTILIIYEYVILQYDGDGESGLVELTISYPEAFRYFQKQNIPAFILYYPEALQRRFKAFFAPKSNILRSSTFNIYGDIKSDVLNAPPIISREYLEKHAWPIPADPENNANTKKFISHINEFIAFCESKKARVFMTYGPFTRHAYETDGMGPIVERTADLMRKKIKCTFVGKPTDYIFEYEDLFDTVYHLNYRGRVVYTKKLIENLQPRWR